VLPVQVELVSGCPASRELAAKIEENFKRSLGASAHISLLPHGAFPVTEGKTRRVIRGYE